jgi:predicted DNA binding protein
MVVVLIDVNADDFALGKAFSGTDTRIDLAQFVPVDGRLVPFCWADTDTTADREDFERAVGDDPQIATFERLDGGASRTLYRIEWIDEVDGFVDALADGDVIVERAFARAGTDTWTFRLRALDHEALSRFQAACTEEGVAFDVRRIAHDPKSVEGYGLTDKQQAALTLAFDEGYFDVPRGASKTELAEHIGISRQAFSRRLSRALSNCLVETGITELERPADAGREREN